MSFTMPSLTSLFKRPVPEFNEQQKLHRILASAAEQRVELHLVFSQRLIRPTPIRGRFVRFERDRILIVLDVSAVHDAWQQEPCSVYFSVRGELSGSYAFSSPMLGHEPYKGITRALIALPTSYTSRRVRRFERLNPEPGDVLRMAVWNFKSLPVSMGGMDLMSCGFASLPALSVPSQTQMDEGPVLRDMLPPTLHTVGAPDYLYTDQKKACELVNVSAGGARLRLQDPQEKNNSYEIADNVLLLLALSRPRRSSLLLTLAGTCCGLDTSDTEQDLKMRFIYWSMQSKEQPLQWAPVTLAGVSPLFEWVAQNLTSAQGKAKGIETSFDETAT